MMSRATSLCQIALFVVVSTCAARAQSQPTSTLQGQNKRSIYLLKRSKSPNRSRSHP